MGAYEVFVLSWRQTPEVFADSLADERFDIGRRHPAYRTGMPGVSLPSRTADSLVIIVMGGAETFNVRVS
jgi:hypothetical protein